MKQTILIQESVLLVDVYHLACCRVCTPPLPQPFKTTGERAEWATAHIAGTGHGIDLATEIRIRT